MTQTNNRFFDEIGRLMNDAAGAAQGVKREVDTVMRNQAERILRDLDLVKREEFDAVKDIVPRKPGWSAAQSGTGPIADTGFPGRCFASSRLRVVFGPKTAEKPLHFLVISRLWG
jgi:hypothetical protein